MTLFLPQFQQRFHNYHFARSLPVTELIIFIIVDVISFVISDGTKHLWSTSRQVRVIADLTKGDETRKYLHEHNIEELQIITAAQLVYANNLLNIHKSLP